MSKYGTWKDLPRENVPWYPTVDQDKCIGCKECYNFCSHDVYKWDEEDSKPVVEEPFFCVVGCSSCAGLCPENAISFPPLNILKEFIKS